MIFSLVTSPRSNKSSAGKNSFGNSTCSESSCFFADSGTALSGFVAASVLFEEDGNELSSCVTKTREVGSDIAGDAAL
jgi:hypothetical protein